MQSLLPKKVGMETLHAIQYKLRMMGIPILGASYIYGDNMSVIHNTSNPGSRLRKKCIVIAYHAIHKSVAMGKSLTGQLFKKGGYWAEKEAFCSIGTLCHIR